MADTVSGKATPHRPGLLKRLYIKNFARLAGEQEIDVGSEAEGAPSIVSFTGDNGTGKGTLLHALSAIQILRDTYRVEQNEQGMRLQPVGGGYSAMDCDGTCLYPGPYTVCTHSLTQQSSLEQSLIGNHTHSYHFHKYRQEGIALCLVEVTGHHTEHPVIYGLFADEGEDQWVWHQQDGDGCFTYSTLFVYDSLDGSLYLSSPTRTFSTQHPGLILHFIKPFHQRQRQTEMIELFSTMISQCLRNEIQCENRLETIPERLKEALPSNVITQYTVECHRMKNNAELINHILEQLTTMPSNCILVEHAFNNSNPHNTDQYLHVICRKCKELDIQFVFTTYSDAVLKHSSIDTVVRFTSGLSGACRAVKVKPDFFIACKEQKWNPNCFLSYDLIVLVESQSDENILNPLLMPKNWEGRIDTQEEVRMKQLLSSTRVLQVGGKNRFPVAHKFLLTHAYLGLAQCIVCDGDALFGVILPDCSEHQQPETSESSGISKGYRSILYTCIENLGSELVRTAYNTLLDVRSGREEIVADRITALHKLPVLPPSELRELVHDVTKWHCATEDDAQSFSQTHLYTFVWRPPHFQNLLNWQTKHPRAVREYARSSIQCRKMAVDMIKKKNSEVLRLFNFLENQVLPMFARLESVLM